MGSFIHNFIDMNSGIIYTENAIINNKEITTYNNGHIIMQNTYNNVL